METVETLEQKAITIMNTRINELHKVKREAIVTLSNIDEAHFLYKRAKHRLDAIDDMILLNARLIKELQGSIYAN